MKPSNFLVYLLFLGALIFIGCVKPWEWWPFNDSYHPDYYWRLDSYTVNNRSGSRDEVSKYSYLSFANTSDGNKQFNFWDKEYKPTLSWLEIQRATYGGRSIYSKDGDVETTIFRDRYVNYFKAIMVADLKTLTPVRLELSNLIRLGYRAEEDTVRMVFVPVASFKDSLNRE